MTTFKVPKAPAWFGQKLFSIANDFGLTLENTQVELMVRHAELVFYWNRTSNLTAINSWEDMLNFHYLDSLVPSLWLPKYGNALDIGTGAGFPGVPIKIAYPKLNITLCDKKRKKANFLKVFLAFASLDSISIHLGEWQQLARHRFRGFDLVMVRALSLSVLDINYIVDNLLSEKGVLAVWAGVNPRFSKRLKGLFGKVGLKSYHIPGLKRRYLVLIGRSGYDEEVWSCSKHKRVGSG